MGAAIDPATDPMLNPSVDPVGYDQATRTHTIYSEDTSLYGLQPYTVRAHLTNYPVTQSSDATATIEFKDPCPDPESVTAPILTDPADYYYTAQAPKLVFTNTAYTVEPPICVFTYSCTVTSGLRTDLCAIADGTTHGVFDPITGNYEFYSIDMANYQPGQYTFEITGTVGTKSASATFTMTLVDPCPTTVLSIIEPDPFTDKTYPLRSPQVDQIWDIDNLITKATSTAS